MTKPKLQQLVSGPHSTIYYFRDNRIMYIKNRGLLSTSQSPSWLVSTASPLTVPCEGREAR